jgi:hypothetical protein
MSRIWVVWPRRKFREWLDGPTGAAERAARALPDGRQRAANTAVAAKR